MIAIVDYGSGNLQAIANIYKRLNIEARITASEPELRAADKIILPGVGAFDQAMHSLNVCGLREPLTQLVREQGKPVLGICVGMQMLARRSDEGSLSGLGWIGGEVRRFDVTTFSHRTHLPHMGWNDVCARGDHPLLRDLQTGARFYFLHSYYFAPDSPTNVLAETEYNGTFASSIHAGNVFGVQFHPEKSHSWGIRLLKNFAEL